jgi:molecular chaperone GrpE
MMRSDEDAAREDAPEDLEGEVATAAAAEATPEARIAELEAELDQARQAHARAVADYQNLRRRSNEERAEQARLTMKTLVLNYLPVLDDLNRALDSVGDHQELSDHPWVEGVRIVQRKFTAILEAAGARAVEAAVGSPFNPELHEAVANQPGPLNEIIGVIQSGYMLDGMVIRPAMVVVGNGEGPPGSSGA